MDGWGAILWSIVTHPDYVRRPADVPALLVWIALVAGVTSSFMLVVGTRIARWSVVLAVGLGTLFVPALLLALAAFAVATTPAGDVDSHAMLAVSAIATGVLSLPMSFAASLCLLLWRQWRRGRTRENEYPSTCGSIAGERAMVKGE